MNSPPQYLEQPLHKHVFRQPVVVGVLHEDTLQAKHSRAVLVAEPQGVSLPEIFCSQDEPAEPATCPCQLIKEFYREGYRHVIYFLTGTRRPHDEFAPYRITSRCPSGAVWGGIVGRWASGSYRSRRVDCAGGWRVCGCGRAFGRWWPPARRGRVGPVGVGAHRGAWGRPAPRPPAGRRASAGDHSAG